MSGAINTDKQLVELLAKRQIDVVPVTQASDQAEGCESLSGARITLEQLRQVIAELTPRQVFDTEDAAKYLGVSKQLLELLRVRGDGPRYVKLHRLVRYRRESLDEWLIQQERCHTSELRPAVRGLRCQKSNLEKL